MGADLYISVEVKYESGAWLSMWTGASTALARGIIVDAFGYPEEAEGPRAAELGYKSREEQQIIEQHPECPWPPGEPYWVRVIDGNEFSLIVSEQRWQKLQDGDFHDLDCGPELRAMASLVESLVTDDVPVRVWCWHSQ